MIASAAAQLKKVMEHQSANQSRQTVSLFAENPDRFEAFSAKCGELLFDYSKCNVSNETMELLLELATHAKVSEKRAALFAGDTINSTENRAVQHMALRNMSGSPVIIDGKDVMPDVLAVRQDMAKFAEGIRSGEIAGQGGKFTDIVNIGIGGSDLGPVMATAALGPFHDGPHTHFVSNIDGADICEVLKKVDPATTLFIVASKTFTTQETMTNANTARQWLVEALGE